MKLLRLFAVASTFLLGVTSAYSTTVTDPVGDNGGVGPDIISMSGTYNSTTLYLNVQFAPGTFDPTKSAVIIGLNTDRNTSTGCCGSSGAFFPLGAEYALSYIPSAGNQFALVSYSSDGNTHTVVSNVTPTFVTNGVNLSLPLSLIGGNGLLNFGVAAGTDNGNSTFAYTDFLPDLVGGKGYINAGPTSLEQPETLVICGGDREYGGTCVLPNNTTTVYYGASGAYRSRVGVTQITCSPDGFNGDPLVGVVKICFYYVEPARLTWNRCANEGETCTITGNHLVRYGDGTNWVYKSLTGATGCDNGTFGDSSPGTRKACQVAQ